MRYFTLDEANALLPEARQRLAVIQDLAAELNRGAAALSSGAPDVVPADLKAVEARISEALEWFTAEGIHVKGIAPALLDFPARHDDADVLLCWLETEDTVTHYHPLDTGFAGRTPLER